MLLSEVAELGVIGLADVLVALAADPERVAEMGRAARARVVRDHDAGRQVERLQSLHTREAQAGA